MLPPGRNKVPGRIKQGGGPRLRARDFSCNGVRLFPQSLDFHKGCLLRTLRRRVWTGVSGEVTELGVLEGQGWVRVCRVHSGERRVTQESGAQW